MLLRALARLTLAGLILAALPAPSSAAVAHGHTHTALGSSVVTTGTDGSLLVSNIGSKGLDGVSITLPNRGSLIRLRTKINVGGSNDLSLHRVPGDNTPIIKGCALRSGPDRVYSVDVPASTSIVVEVWSSTQLMFSRVLASNTEVTVQGACLSDSFSSLGFSTSAGPAGSSTHRVSLSHHVDQDCDLTVDGVTVTGRSLVFTAELPGPPEPAAEARLTFATELGSPPGEVVITEEAVSSGLALSPPALPAHEVRALESSVRGGAVDVADPSACSMSYAADGSGGELVIALSPTPTGTADRALRALEFSLFARPPGVLGHSQRFEAQVEYDDYSGLPPSLHVVAAEWTATTSGACDVTGLSTIPSDELLWQVRSAGVAVGPPSPSGPGSLLHGSTRPTGYAMRTADDFVAHSLHFAPGTVFDAPGSPSLIGDELVLHAHGGVGTPSAKRKISDVHIVHPPGTPPGTWRIGGGGGGSGGCGGSLHASSTDEGGRASFARGPRQTVSLDGAYDGSPAADRRLSVKNLGSSGQDGVEVMHRGLPSVSFELHENPSDVPPVAMRLVTLPCPDGSCPPRADVEIEETTNGQRIRKGMQDINLRSLHVEVNGAMLPYPSADLDGDSWLELTTPPSSTGAAAVRGKVKSIRDTGNGRSERTSFTLTSPMEITCDDGVHLITELHVWYNPVGLTSVPLIPLPQVARLTASPPDGPVDGRYGACDMTLSPPGLQVSGSLSLRADVATPRAGFLTRATWGQAEGPVLLSSGASSDEMRLEPTGMLGAPALERALVASGGPDDDCDGFVFERLPTSISVVWSPRSLVRVAAMVPSGLGGPDEMLHALDWEDDGGAPTELRYVTGLAGGGPATVRVYVSGGLVTEQLADVVTMSSPPTAVFAGGDLDGDGLPEIDARGIAGGSTITISGNSFPCDRVTFSPPSSPPALHISSARVLLNGLPPGVPVEGVRLSAVISAIEVTSAPPALPTGRTLELRGVTPNPARGHSTVRLALGGRAAVRVDVLDIAGRVVATLQDGELAAGEHFLVWSGRTSTGGRAAAGLYLVRVSGAGLPSSTTRMVRLD